MLVLILSLAPHPPKLDIPYLSWDKFQHTSAYALLTFLTERSWRCFRPHWSGVWWGAGGCVLLFGLCLELLQGVMRLGRHADPYDVLANSLGILGATLLTLFWRQLHRP